MPLLDPDRLFPASGPARGLARALYAQVSDAPIVSPHGHVDPAWFARNAPFRDATELFIVPDHYVTRMLVSQGIPLSELGVPRADGTVEQPDRRKIWQTFAAHYHLFRATPSRMWLDHVFETLFGFEVRLSAATADLYFDRINDALQSDAFRPRALYERFGIEVLATTEGPLDDLAHHAAIRDSGWGGRVITTYRPDAVIDPETPGFAANIEALGQITGQPATTWSGYLAAHADRRAYFRSFGATATDHGHPSAATTVLSQADAATLFDAALRGTLDAEGAERFRAHMLVEMARMSVDDGMVMQLHPGSRRNHAAGVFQAYGADKGFDIPGRTDYVRALQPLLDELGHHPAFRLILFTLDETTLSRELAPLAGAYPAVLLGPAWWFLDSPEGMRRFREATTETAGFYNTVGFNDDTRALCSIPARHDVARRIDCAYLAELVASGRLARDEAEEVAQDLAHRLARKAYKL